MDARAQQGIHGHPWASMSVPARRPAHARSACPGAGRGGGGADGAVNGAKPAGVEPFEPMPGGTEIGFLICTYAIPAAWIPASVASIITGAGYTLTVLLKGRMEHFLDRYACRIRTKT